MRLNQILFGAAMILGSGFAFAGPNFHLICKKNEKQVLSVFDLMAGNQHIVDFKFSPDADDSNSTFRAERSTAGTSAKFEDVFMARNFIVGRFFYEDGSLIKFKSQGETTFNYDYLKSIYIERKIPESDQHPVEITKVILQFGKGSGQKNLKFDNCYTQGGGINTWWKWN